MIKRMLIDATQPEETRVVVINGTRLEELDVETSTKRQIKGNIYLAKVVRVEPSLQAAFVDYGGNRHGFLAFNEIHSDYYHIPVSDRRRLLAEQRRAEAESNAVESEEGDVESVGGDEVDAPPPPPPPAAYARSGRDYKIQEVIKRRQILLVQVAKEERGNKGAALTTHLSLAGRYCVLMPNAGRGGGVSRKITSIADRRRLKSMLNEFGVPEGMGVILRTAGSERSKAEIRRDYEYLMRTWSQVRDATLKSQAPVLIHEEATLIKRSIRDIYTRDIDEVIVAGDEGYRQAKDFMRTLTPSHAKKVQPYKETSVPLFHRYQVSAQLDAMHSPIVQLKAGGYIVFNQTEALVAVDVNSGKATKERHIEETALKTNLEAADEIARQLRLRDLAGLIVIDFIDMEESRNNQAVERRVKEALSSDRARIQMGRISVFGLLELSRQRLRPSLMETSFETCPHCAGAGVVRSVESSAMHVLRIIEEEGLRRRSSEIMVTCPTPVALYILNQKRVTLTEIEQRHAFRVLIGGDDKLIPPDSRLERLKTRDDSEGEVADLAPPPLLVQEDDGEDEEAAPQVAAPQAALQVASRAETAVPSPRSEDKGAEDTGEKKRRRRRRRSRRGEGGEGGAESSAMPGRDEAGRDEAGHDDVGGDLGETAADRPPEGEVVAGEEGEDAARKPRRRGRRGGRRRRRPAEDGSPETSGSEQAAGEETEESSPVGEEESVPESTESATEPAKRRRVVRRPRPEAVETEAPPTEEASSLPPTEEVSSPPPTEEASSSPPTEEAPQRSGWWKKLLP